jgi:hypothetical protein
MAGTDLPFEILIDAGAGLSSSSHFRLHRAAPAVARPAGRSRRSRLASRRSSRSVREMFSYIKSNGIRVSVCIGLRASCRVCARPAKWRA